MTAGITLCNGIIEEMVGCLPIPCFRKERQDNIIDSGLYQECVEDISIGETNERKMFNMRCRIQ